MTGRRIGHLVASWPQRGGVADAIRDLVVAAEQAGDTAKIYAWPDAGSKVGMLAQLRRLPAPMAEDLRNLDVVVMHGVFTPGLAFAARTIGHRFPDVRLVAFPHDAYDAGLFSSRRRIKLAYWRAIEGPYLRRVDLIQTTAPSHSQWLRDRGIATPIVMRPFGLPAAVSQPLMMPPGRQPLRLLFVGRWDVHEKGLDLLIAALASRAELRSGWRLRLVGPEVGAREKLLALAGSAGLDVDLIGWVPDLTCEFAAAGVLILPSRKEGFGLVALQALVAGVPVIVSDVAGITEHLPHNAGWIAVRPDVSSIAEALTVALSESQRLVSQVRAFDPARLGIFSWSRLHESLVGA